MRMSRMPARKLLKLSVSRMYERHLMSGVPAGVADGPPGAQARGSRFAFAYPAL
jgi:hypothetical protein